MKGGKRGEGGGVGIVRVGMERVRVWGGWGGGGGGGDREEGG